MESRSTTRCSSPKTEKTTSPNSNNGLTTINCSSPAITASPLAPSSQAAPKIRVTNALPSRTPSRRIPHTTDNTRGRSRSEVRSTIRAEKAVPPAEIAVPSAREISVSTPIQTPTKGRLGRATVSASCKTTQPANPNSNEKARALFTMNGVRLSPPPAI